MYKRARWVLGLVGLSLFVIGLAITINASASPLQRISYWPPPGETPRVSVWDKYAYDPIPTVLVVGGAIFLFLALTGNIRGHLAVDIHPRRRYLLFTWGILLIAIGVAVGVLVYSQMFPFSLVPPLLPTPTAISTTVVPYRAEISLNGPDRMHFGTSTKIELTINVVSNTIPSATIPLTTSGNYSATVRIQAPSFDVSEGVTGVREVQVLSIRSPVRWAWVISPREKRLGSQELVFDVFIHDQYGNRIGAPWSPAKVYVTDPIGIPPGVVYLGTLVGGIMTVPLWTWIYNEWSMRRKEKREQRRKFFVSRRGRKR